MITVKMDQEIAEKLAGLVKNDKPGACVRLKEYTIGGGCHATKMLGLTIDQRDELEDQQAVVDGITFIANEDFLCQYGESFQIVLDEGRFLVKGA